MIRIPADLTAEAKTVLAVLSMRQLLIVGPVLVISIINLIFINYPFITGWAEFIIKLLFLVIANGISCSLAFIYMNKYDCYLSQFVVQLVKFHLSQKIYTN